MRTRGATSSSVMADSRRTTRAHFKDARDDGLHRVRNTSEKKKHESEKATEQFQVVNADLKSHDLKLTVYRNS